MTEPARWKEAQGAEREYWSSVAGAETEIERVLADNLGRAKRLETWLPATPRIVLEIGVGGLGVGVLGFLARSPVRVGLDPLPPISLTCAKPLRDRVQSLRQGLLEALGSGEAVPVAVSSTDLVICCNVLDHVHDPTRVLSEVRRVLKPGAAFFLEVDTFSLLGLMKWHLWTKRLHSNEILVRAHPHRFLEKDVVCLLEEQRFEVVKTAGRSSLEKIVGHSRPSAFLAVKRQGP